MFIFPRYTWINSICRAEQYDLATGEIILVSPGSYDIYLGDRFYIQHVREGLDSPGEWHYANGFLEYMPLGKPFDAHVSIVVSESIVALCNAAWISFHGIIFDRSDVQKTGSTGIVVGRGERKTYSGRYTPCRNTVTNCYVHHVGLIKKSIPGILIGGEGTNAAVGVTVKVTHG